MAAAERYRRDDHIPPVSDAVDDRAAEFSNDSDDSSERARYTEIKTFFLHEFASNYSHGIKRGGNNHFGSTGILKCLTCRKRKGRVIDHNTKTLTKV
jgi:hypothetical protein